jgi:hypothetical protein
MRMRKVYLITMMLAAWLGTAAAATAPAPVRMPNIPTPSSSSQPVTAWQRIYGPVSEGVLPPETLVCPGMPVILNAVMVPPPGAWVGSPPEIRFELVQGLGWFGSYEDIKLDPPGFWKKLFKRLRPGPNARAFSFAPDRRTGSTAVVFYPLGEEGDPVHLRARCADTNLDLGTVEYHFKVGANRGSDFKRLVDKGLKQEQKLDTINFRWNETVVATSPFENLMARGRVMNVDRIFGNGYMDSVYHSGEVADKNIERKPYKVEESPYYGVRYWGETPNALIGTKGDPDPPGPNGSVMLYYYNKETGLMQEFRFYGTQSCGRGLLMWNQGVSGVYFNTQIQKRTWSPPTQLWEQHTILRRDIRLLDNVEMKQVP